MDAKNKKYWIIAILGLIAVVVLIIWRKKNQELQKAEDVPNEAAPVKLNDQQKVVSTFPIKKGSTGPEVFKVQAWLLKNEGAQIKVDGIWGNETEKAVNKFLKVNGISEAKYKSMGL